MRDTLFLTWFPVTSLPFFVGVSAILAVPTVEAASRLLVRFDSARVVPTALALSGVLFITEWLLLDEQPRAVAILLYMHSSVLTAIAISMFWSLLNEHVDPHSAKPLMAHVAAAAAFGGLAGGVGAERIAAVMPEGALLLALGLGGGVCMIGAVIVGRAAPARQNVREDVRGVSGWNENPPSTSPPQSGSGGDPSCGACRPRRLRPQGGSGRVLREGRAPPALLRTLLRGDRPRRVLPTGHRGAFPARSSRSRRRRRQSRRGSRHSQCAQRPPARSMGRDRSTRPGRRGARVDLPRRIRVVLHPAGGCDEALSQVDHRRGRRLSRKECGRSGHPDRDRSRSGVRVGCRERGQCARGGDGVPRGAPAQIRLRERARGRTQAPG